MSYLTNPYMVSPAGCVPTGHGRGFFCGGISPYRDYNDTVMIDTPANASDWGGLVQPVASAGGGGWFNTARQVIGFGYDYPPSAVLSLQYFDAESSGISIDFGDGTGVRMFLFGLANDTYSIFGGGDTTGGGYYLDDIQYVTTDTTSGTSSFGDISSGAISYVGGACDGTYGVIVSGNHANPDPKWVDIITVDTPANSVLNNDMLVIGGKPACCHTDSRVVVQVGGYDDQLEYFDMTTTSTAQNFGDLTTSPFYSASTANNCTGLWGGGSEEDSGNYDVINAVTMSTPSNATNFGGYVLTQARYNFVGSPS